jgi:ribose-phosphate pyrophosphokinase
MRQDTRFRPGQARSAHAFGRFLSSTVDWLITVDPHLHRLHGLDDVFSIPARSLSAMGAVADWVGRNVQNPILIGPDQESAQWAERVAATLSAPWAVLEKVRSGDRNVSVTLPDPALVRDHNPVVIDDIVSSGHTLMEVVSGLRRLGSRPPTCVTVHGLFDTDTEVAIRNAGAARIVSTSTVPHASNQIDVAALIAEAVEEMYHARLGKTDIGSSGGA